MHGSIAAWVIVLKLVSLTLLAVLACDHWGRSTRWLCMHHEAL